MRTRTIVLGYGVGVLMGVVFFATIMGKLDWHIGLPIEVTLLVALIATRFWD